MLDSRLLASDTGLVTKGSSTMTNLVKQHLEELNGLCLKYQVAHLELFGSAVSEEKFDAAKSDIDFLVEFVPMSPAEHAKAYFGLLAELQDLFEKQIDLVEIKAVTNPYLLESLEKSRTEIYAA